MFSAALPQPVRKGSAFPAQSLEVCARLSRAQKGQELRPVRRNTMETHRRLADYTELLHLTSATNQAIQPSDIR